MSPGTDAIMSAPIVFQENEVEGENIHVLLGGNPMLAQMPNPQMVAAPQMATAASMDQQQEARAQKSPIVPHRARVLIVLTKLIKA